jgi:hypothetical protein
MAKSSKSGEAKPTRAPSRRRSVKTQAAATEAAAKPAVQDESPVSAAGEPGSLAPSSVSPDASQVAPLHAGEEAARRPERPASDGSIPGEQAGFQGATPAAAPRFEEAPAGAIASGRPGAGATRRPGSDDIRRRAFELFMERGGRHGHDLEDWLKAEQELSRR